MCDIKIFYFVPGLAPLTPVTKTPPPACIPAAPVALVTATPAPTRLPRHPPTEEATGPGPGPQQNVGRTAMMVRGLHEATTSTSDEETRDPRLVAPTGTWKGSRMATHTLRVGIKLAPCRQTESATGSGRGSTESGMRDILAAMPTSSTVSHLCSPRLLLLTRRREGPTVPIPLIQTPATDPNTEGTGRKVAPLPPSRPTTAPPRARTQLGP